MLGRKNIYRELEKSIGYRFRDRSLLEMALLHRSFRFEQKQDMRDNQRLEFLGDAVLGMAVAAYLFKTYEDKLEGDMTSLRSRVTSGKALSAIARGVGLGGFIKMGKGEEKSGGRDRSSNLEDAMEAVIGAAWLDGGNRATDKIFKTVFIPEINALSDNVWADNPKGELQEYVQSHWKGAPLYRLVKREGPQHAAVFYVEVEMPDGRKACGSAHNKQGAEALAAAEMLKML